MANGGRLPGGSGDECGDNVGRVPVVRTALNAHISRWRRRRREVSVPDPTSADMRAVSEEAGSLVDPTIIAALLRLPARQRQVIAFRPFLDLGTGRTAEVLGVAPSTAKSHLARAVDSLRRDLTLTRQQETPS